MGEEARKERRGCLNEVTWKGFLFRLEGQDKQVRLCGRNTRHWPELPYKSVYGRSCVFWKKSKRCQWSSHHFLLAIRGGSAEFHRKFRKLWLHQLLSYLLMLVNCIECIFGIPRLPEEAERLGWDNPRPFPFAFQECRRPSLSALAVEWSTECKGGRFYKCRRCRRGNDTLSNDLVIQLCCSNVNIENWRLLGWWKLFPFSHLEMDLVSFFRTPWGR